MLVPRCVVTLLAAFAALSLWGPAPIWAQALDGTITYQGQLKQSGSLLNASADFEFRLFSALTGGTQVGSTVPVNNVNVVDGVFTVPLNFGTVPFSGDQRWLEIAVRSPAGAGSFETLTPRQPLTSAPYALYALSGPPGPWVVNGNNIHNTNAGFVGIGTTSPAKALHVRADDPVLVLQDSTPQSSPTPYFSFRDSNSNELGRVGYDVFGSQALSITNSQFNGNLRFLTQNIERLTITQNGAVGIGTTTPLAEFDVSTAFGRYFRYSSSSGVVINRNENGTLMNFALNGTFQGSISVSGSTVSYNGFMGSHYAWMDGDHSIDRGALVSMTGENQRLNGSAEGDVVYGIEPTSIANDAACLGAYLGIMEPDKATDLANPHLIAAVGNGEMLVVDSGTGGIRPGDYLISADVAGCAMKDDSQRFSIGHIVARAAQRVDWSTVVPDANGRKVARISVFFENFVRSR